MRKTLFVCFAVAVAVACSDGSGPTGPSRVPSEPVAVTPAVPSSGTPTAAPAPEPEGKNPGPTSVSCTDAGVCTFSNTGQAAKDVDIACTLPLQHDPIFGHSTVTVPPGQGTLVINVRDYCDKDVDRCEGETRKVQVDFTAGQGEHIGHWGLKEGQEIVYEGNEEYCEPPPKCEPGEWVDTENTTEWEEDFVVDCPVTAQNGEEECTECFQESRFHEQSNGCETRSRNETRTRRREIECPSPRGGICHVSNTGNPNSGNVELRVQLKNGGEGHLNHCADFPPFLISANEDETPACVQVGPGTEAVCSCHTVREKWLACDSQD